MKNNLGNWFDSPLNTIKENAHVTEYQNVSTIEMVEAQAELIAESGYIDIELHHASIELNEKLNRIAESNNDRVAVISEGVFGENGWLAKIWAFIKRLWEKAVKAVKKWFGNMTNKDSQIRKNLAQIVSNLEIISKNSFKATDELNLNKRDYKEVMMIVMSFITPAWYILFDHDKKRIGGMNFFVAIQMYNKSLEVNKGTFTKSITGLSTTIPTPKGAPSIPLYKSSSVSNTIKAVKEQNDKYKATVGTDKKKSGIKFVKALYDVLVDEEKFKTFKKESFSTDKTFAASAFAAELLTPSAIGEDVKGTQLTTHFNEIKRHVGEWLPHVEATLDSKRSVMDDCQEAVDSIKDKIDQLSAGTSHVDNGTANGIKIKLTEEDLKELKDASDEMLAQASGLVDAIDKGSKLGTAVLTVITKELLASTDKAVKLSKQQ